MSDNASIHQTLAGEYYIRAWMFIKFLGAHCWGGRAGSPGPYHPYNVRHVLGFTQFTSEQAIQQVFVLQRGDGHDLVARF